MNKKTNSFLRSAIILFIALVVIIVFMPEWGAAQVIVCLIVAGLAAMQLWLYFYLKKK